MTWHFARFLSKTSNTYKSTEFKARKSHRAERQRVQKDETERQNKKSLGEQKKV
jgi:hypothetical protein